jgi:hemerythrin-like domain-containing protein
MHAPPAPSDEQAAAWPGTPVEVLDACHREIVHTLQDLRALVLHVGSTGLDESSRETARRIHLFLSTDAVRHHQDEERHVFPVLLRQHDPLLAHQVQQLQDQHGRLEAAWLELAPLLDAAARGHRWRDIGDVAARVDHYTALYLEHVALEETEVYPHARGLLDGEDLQRMRNDMSLRRRRLNPGEDDEA